MHTYTPPLWDLNFALEHIAGLEEIAALPGYEHADLGVVAGLLEEAGKFFAEVWAPTNQEGDRVGATWDDGEVILPESLVAAWHKLLEAGWHSLSFDEAYGGGGMPYSVGSVITEMMLSSNKSLSMLPGLSNGAIELLEKHGSEEQKETYLNKLVSGVWSGTMNLTEPEAGSDVGALRTKAVRQDDGSYRIFGTKIFISFGEHTATENIVHLVLARTPDAPPGTKGISCFIVPKFLVAEDGSLGERNDVKCVSIEHKMGIKSSPTCVMSYGDEGGAVGYLIGEENRGMRYMFTMMNNARIGVAIEGPALAEIAYQAALAYARERVQGRPLGAPADGTYTIIDHADVRRMLMTMKAQVEAMRGLIFLLSGAADRAKAHPDPDVRARNAQLVDLLTPVAKGWCTDTGCEVASTAIQVHGGMGYIEEAGVSQIYRDVRIAPIYEGTNGIQALDLIGRKLPLDGGKPVLDLFADVRLTVAALADAGQAFDTIRENLTNAVNELEKSTFWIFEHGIKDPNEAAAGATPFLRQFGLTVGGWVLAQEALAAQGRLDKGADGSDRSRLEAKVVTARFFAETLLPEASSLTAAATQGKETLFAIDATHL